MADLRAQTVAGCSSICNQSSNSELDPKARHLHLKFRPQRQLEKAARPQTARLARTARRAVAKVGSRVWVLGFRGIRVEGTGVSFEFRVWG